MIGIQLCGCPSPVLLLSIFQALLWVEAYQSKWMNPCHGPNYLNMSWKRFCSLLEKIQRMRRPRAHVLLEHLRPIHLAFAEHQFLIIQHCLWSQTAACGQNILILMEVDTSVPLVNQYQKYFPWRHILQLWTNQACSQDHSFQLTPGTTPVNQSRSCLMFLRTHWRRAAKGVHSHSNPQETDSWQSWGL